MAFEVSSRPERNWTSSLFVWRGENPFMNQRARRCVETLAENIQEKEDGGWKYSGRGSQFYDYLMPILVENLDISPSSLRISKKKVYGNINELLLEVKDEKEPASEFEARIEEIIDDISEIDVEEYTLAFPLNYDSRDQDLLPDTLFFKDMEFQSIDYQSWQQDWVPDYENHEGDRDLMKLETFLNKSPNDIADSHYTYWKASCYARDATFAMNEISESLETILGEMNYAMAFNRRQGESIHSGPWPNRWSELRSPFIFLLYSDGEYLNHAFPSRDASYRKPESPHSMREEQFEEIFELLPTFESEQAIDGRLIAAFNMFQSGITTTSYQEGFFEFWRGIELLASIDEDTHSTESEDAISAIVERVAQIYDWQNPKIAKIRLDRVADKRNEYVHEGEYDSINRNDYNLTKTLLEGMINFAYDNRTDWDVGDWNYVLRNFETDEDIIEDKQSRFERKIELLDELKEIGDD